MAFQKARNANYQREKKDLEEAEKSQRARGRQWKINDKQISRKYEDTGPVKQKLVAVKTAIKSTLKGSFWISKVLREIKMATIQNNSIKANSTQRPREIFQKIEHKQRDGA